MRHDDCGVVVSNETITINGDEDLYYWMGADGRVLCVPVKGADHDLRGQCSGFPPCCIRFFIEQWQNMPDEPRNEYMSKIEGIGYIPCPDCLAKQNFVEPKDCEEANCICGQWKHRQSVEDSLDAIRKKERRRNRMARKKRRGYF